MSDATTTPSGFDQLKRSVPARFKAAGIHLSLSSIAFAVALYLILVRWYPGFHFLIDGGWRGVKIMAGVDLVLGPALTLVIFNPFKARKLIVFDLSVIALIQVAALVWGFYAVHSQRPVVVSFYDGAFYSVTAEPLAVERQPADYAERFSERRPPVVYVRPPANDDESERVTIQEMVGSVAAYEDPYFFDRLDLKAPAVAKHAIGAAERGREKKAFTDALSAFLERAGGTADDYLYFRYIGRDGTCTVAFRASGELVDALGCVRN